MRKIDNYIQIILIVFLLILVLASAFFPDFFEQFYAGWSWANFILIIVSLFMCAYYQHNNYTISGWSNCLFLIADNLFFLTTMIVPNSKNIVVWVNQYTPWIILLTALNISFIFWEGLEEK